MSITKRHHFIPVFYLKQFTNDAGFFHVYDVRKNAFKENGKLFAPSTHFYEHYGNTIYNESEQSDFIESSFSENDKTVSAIIQKINAGHKHELDPNEWTMLQYFVNIMYWRIPANIDKVKAFTQNANSIKDLGMRLRQRKTGGDADTQEQAAFLQKLKADTEFYKFMKLMLPGITFPEIFKKEVQNSAHLFGFELSLPKLVSDNPIIYRNPGIDSLHTDDFIFPITPTEVLFRHSFKQLRIYPQVRAFIDMMLVIQAKEYVSCSDLTYPIQLKEQFASMFTSVEDLRKAIFAGILDGDLIKDNKDDQGNSN